MHIFIELCKKNEQDACTETYISLLLGLNTSLGWITWYEYECIP